jgi:hypothetical protein
MPLVSQKRNHSVVPETTAGKKMFQRTSLLHAWYAMESVTRAALSAIRILMQLPVIVVLKNSKIIGLSFFLFLTISIDLFT